MTAISVKDVPVGVPTVSVDLVSNWGVPSLSVGEVSEAGLLAVSKS